MIRSARAFALVACAALLGGCLGEPPVEQRWTRLEILSASPLDANAYAAPTTVTMKARITYRELLTGFLVAELRESATVTVDDTILDDPERHLEIARDVDRIVQGSTVLGGTTVPITGFDHLIHEVDISFDAGIAQQTPQSGLFLVLYFSDDVEEVEVPGGGEIEIIHPVFSTEMDILSTGLELIPGA